MKVLYINDEYLNSEIKKENSAYGSYLYRHHLVHLIDNVYLQYIPEDDFDNKDVDDIFKWFKLFDEMLDVYGVSSFLLNYSDVEDWEEIEFGDIWFTCPECSEPILYEDYNYAELKDHCCPICEEGWEVEEDEEEEE